MISVFFLKYVIFLCIFIFITPKMCLIIRTKSLLMKNYFIVLKLAVLFIIISLKVNAQTNMSNWQIGANVGIIIYQGDLTPTLFGDYRIDKPTFGLNISRILTPAFKLRTAISLGKINGDENIYPKPTYRQQRNLKFSTPIAEITEVLIWNFLDHKEDINYKRFSPYILAGVGVSFLNIKRSSTNINATFLENESQAAIGLAQDLQTTPPKTILVLPMGLGVEYYVSPSVSLNLEMNFRYTRTDYLDGFSKIANPNVNDYYYTGTVGIIYKFNKKSMLGCPVFSY